MKDIMTKYRNIRFPLLLPTDSWLTRAPEAPGGGSEYAITISMEREILHPCMGQPANSSSDNTPIVSRLPEDRHGMWRFPAKRARRKASRRRLPRQPLKFRCQRDLACEFSMVFRVSDHMPSHFCNEREHQGPDTPPCLDDELRSVIADLQDLQGCDSHLGDDVNIRCVFVPDFYPHWQIFGIKGYQVRQWG